jgi:hypothetical protein
MEPVGIATPAAERPQRPALLFNAGQSPLLSGHRKSEFQLDVSLSRFFLASFERDELSDQISEIGRQGLRQHGRKMILQARRAGDAAPSTIAIAAIRYQILV